MKVTIVGPNLRDQSKGQFIVHEASCADLRRLARREPEVANGWTIEVESEQDIVEAVYSDHMAERTEDDPWSAWEPYRSDFHFCPCVRLPYRNEDAEPVNLTVTLSYGPFADKAEAEAFADSVLTTLSEEGVYPAHRTVDIYPEAS